jgi:hypothetical protein
VLASGEARAGGARWMIWGEIPLTRGAGKEKEEANGWDHATWVVGCALAVRVEQVPLP